MKIFFLSLLVVVGSIQAAAGSDDTFVDMSVIDCPLISLKDLFPGLADESYAAWCQRLKVECAPECISVAAPNYCAVEPYEKCVKYVVPALNLTIQAGYVSPEYIIEQTKLLSLNYKKGLIVQKHLADQARILAAQ